MSRMPAACLALLLLIPLAFADDAKPKFELPKPSPDGKIAIFNGKDLTGWYGDTTLFKVDNGEIGGKTEKGIKQNEVLKSQVEAGDFRLVLQIKPGPNSANSGVQCPSRPFKSNEMKGYQAHPGAGWGA